MSIYTALITPFDREDRVDEDILRSLFEAQVEAGIDGVLVLGTTAETPTLTQEEKERILAIASEFNKQLHLIVGCGTNCTRTTLQGVEWAAENGAHAALVISPYYNRPPPAGLCAHFEEVARHSPCPILLYNHPGRTGVHLDYEMVQRLSAFPQIVGIKDSGDLTHIIDLIVHVKSHRPDFLVLAGDELTALATMTSGGDGFASIAANVIPKLMRQFTNLSFGLSSSESEECAPQTLGCAADAHGHRSFARQKSTRDARALEKPISIQAQQLQCQLWPLWRALFSDTNPIPIKAALELHGYAVGSPRLPLIPLNAEKRAHLSQLLAEVMCLNV